MDATIIITAPITEVSTSDAATIITTSANGSCTLFTRDDPSEEQRSFAPSIEAYLNQESASSSTTTTTTTSSSPPVVVVLKYLPRPEWCKTPRYFITEYLHNVGKTPEARIVRVVDHSPTHLRKRARICPSDQSPYLYDYDKEDHDVKGHSNSTRTIFDCAKYMNDDDDDDESDHHSHRMEQQDVSCDGHGDSYDGEDKASQEQIDFVIAQGISNIIYFDMDKYIWKTHKIHGSSTTSAIADLDNGDVPDRQKHKITYEEFWQRQYCIKQIGMDKHTILHMAIEANATDVALDIIRIEINTRNDIATLNSLRSITMLETPNTAGVTPLILAAQKGNVKVVQQLLDSGVSLSFADYKKSTGAAILQAAHYGQNKVIECMIDYVCHSKRRLYQLIDVTNRNWTTPLMRAAQEGHLSTVKLLLNHKAYEDGQNKLGMTPLMLAAQRGHTEICQLLITHAAKVNQLTNHGNNSTALLLACKQGHLAVVKELLVAGCDLEIVNIDRLTTRQVIQRRIQRRRAAPQEIYLDPERPLDRQNSYDRRRRKERLSSDDSDGGIDDDDNDIYTITSETDEKLLLMLNPHAQGQLMQLSKRRLRNFEILRIYRLLQENRANIKSRCGMTYDIPTVVGWFTRHVPYISASEWSIQFHLSQGEQPTLSTGESPASVQALLRTMLLPAPILKKITLYLPLTNLWDKKFGILWKLDNPNDAIVYTLDVIDEVLEEGGFLSACDAALIPAPTPHQSWCDWKRVAKPNACWSDVDIIDKGNEEGWNRPNNGPIGRLSITSSLPPPPRDVNHPTILELRRLVGYTSLLSQYQSQTNIVKILSEKPYHMERQIIGELIRISDLSSICRRCCIEPRLFTATGSTFNHDIKFESDAQLDMMDLLYKLMEWLEAQANVNST